MVIITEKEINHKGWYAIKQKNQNQTKPNQTMIFKY